MSLAPGGAATVTNSLTLADLLAKGERVTQADLVRLLATISAFHDGLGKVPAEYQGATNAPVPVEILAMIGEALAGRDQWSKIYNTARAETARVGRGAVAASGRRDLAAPTAPFKKCRCQNNRAGSVEDRAQDHHEAPIK